MKIQIQHRTTYRYSGKVTFGTHRLMMRPRESHSIKLQVGHFVISPAHHIRWMRDLYENNVAFVEFLEPAHELMIYGEYVLDIIEKNPLDLTIAPEAAEYPFSYDHDLLSASLPLSQIVFVRDLPVLQEWLNPYWRPGQRIGTLELLQDINASIFKTFAYIRREQKGVQSPAETLESRTGSCRDFATLFIEACRLLGLAARFVSGYLYSAQITGRMSMHAWAEIYLPEAGWIGFDPSWGTLTDSRYFPVAVNRNSEDCPPVSGTYIGTKREYLESEVDLFVSRLDSGESVAPAPIFKHVFEQTDLLPTGEYAIG